LSPIFECRFLFRTSQLYKPKTILELGTSFGISTLYLLEGNCNAHIITLEGAPEVANIAHQQFSVYNRRFNKNLYPKKIDLFEGQFERTLPDALKELKRLDMVFLDGNHKKEPTLAYFEACLNNAHANSVFIVDDIHWSREMNEAWEEIKLHPRVTLSLDLFWQGLVFFRTDFRSKEHISLIKSKYKPLSMGFFND
jgi:predicted O-methyltransferase YrrM